MHDFLCAGDPDIDALITEQLDRIKRAQNFFDDNGVMIITALFHASLPEAYLGQRGVQVLDATGELFNNWTRRIQETGQFLVNVMSPTPDLWREGRSSLSSGEFGARVARRVRLTHAAIRWMLDAPETINHPSPLFPGPDEHLTTWKVRLRKAGLDDSLGDRPLNQQDLLGTLGTFTTVVIRALERLAVPYTEEDREALHFLWNIVAWHLGIGDRATLAPAGLEPPRPRVGRQRPAAHRAGRDGPHLRSPRRAAARTERSRPSDGEGLDAGARLPPAATLAGASRPTSPAISSAASAPTTWTSSEGGYVELLLSHSAVLEYWTKRARTGAVGRMTIGVLSRNVTRFALRAFITQARWSERGLTIDPRIASKWGIQIPPEPRTPART